MKRVLLLMTIALVAVAVAAAQEAPKAEVFGGYSFVRAGTGGLADSINTNGFDAALTGNFHRNVGITADISGQYKDGANMYSFLFGPQFAANAGKARPYAHVLFGANRLGGGGASDTGYAFAFGGGVDVKVSKVVAVRIGQFDYMRTNHASTGINNFRYAAGIVLNLGGK